MSIKYILEDSKNFINDVFIKQLETALGLREDNEVDFF
jgi:hypothetical protein